MWIYVKNIYIANIKVMKLTHLPEWFSQYMTLMLKLNWLIKLIYIYKTFMKESWVIILSNLLAQFQFKIIIDLTSQYLLICSMSEN